MQFDAGITITFPDNSTITPADFDVTFMDHPKRQMVAVRFYPALRPIVLWRGDEYSAIGDWTQAQAEAKIRELLGENQQQALQNLVLTYS